jgi:hypothetical protein
MSKLILPSGLIKPEPLGHRENLKIVGQLGIKLFDENGRLKLAKQKRNLITTVGFQLISDCLFAQSGRPAVASYIAVGTGNTAPAVGDTALDTESDRNAADYSYAALVATLTATFGPGEATGALVEAGMLNASSSGTLLNRVTYSVVNKGASDTMTVTFTFTLS